MYQRIRVFFFGTLVYLYPSNTDTHIRATTSILICMKLVSSISKFQLTGIKPKKKGGSTWDISKLFPSIIIF